MDTDFTENDARRLLASDAEQGALTAEDTARTLGTFARTLAEEGFEPGLVEEFTREFFAAILDRWQAFAEEAEDDEDED